MKHCSLSSAISLSACILLTNAFPLLPKHDLVKKASETRSYSVVAVNGGGATSSGATTATVTDRLTSTLETTVLSTTVVTTAGETTTIVVTASPTTVLVTDTSSTFLTQLETQAASTAIVTTTLPATTDAAVPSTQTAAASASPSVTSSAYDNGQWHTTYYSSWTVTPVASVANVVSSSVDTMPTITEASVIPAATSSQSASTTDWATVYGTWQDVPKNGSWWGKRAQDLTREPLR